MSELTRSTLLIGLAIAGTIPTVFFFIILKDAYRRSLNADDLDADNASDFLGSSYWGSGD